MRNYNPDPIGLLILAIGCAALFAAIACAATCSGSDRKPQPFSAEEWDRIEAREGGAE